MKKSKNSQILAENLQNSAQNLSKKNDKSSQNLVAKNTKINGENLAENLNKNSRNLSENSREFKKTKNSQKTAEILQNLSENSQFSSENSLKKRAKKRKTILLAVSGSIAFYKAYELISAFKKEGFKIKVLLSDGALKFATHLSFEALAHGVLSSQNESWAGKKNHIAFSQNCDVVVFAPASANSINKLASGIADNLFIQTLIAAKAPLIVAPAANPRMLTHFSTQNSLELLRKNGAVIVAPICKNLACGELGAGGLAHIESIIAATKKELFKDEFWRGKKVVVTGGGTREKIDEVRYIGNFSSGKMAKALADAFFALGASVTLLSSVRFENLPYESEYFESIDELEALLKAHKNGDFLIMSAAVGDFCVDFHKGKLKKSDFEKGLDLHLKPSKDLLKNCEFKGKKIGFKLEFDEKNALKNAKNSLKDKNLAMICLNIASAKNQAFESDYNDITLISRDFELNLGRQSKVDLAFEIARKCQEL